MRETQANINSQNDTLIEIIQIPLNSISPAITDLSTLRVSCVYLDTLYIIENQNLLKLCIRNNNSNSNVSIDEFLKKEAETENYPTQIIVNQNFFYVSFPYKILAFTLNGKLIFSYTHPREIYKFNIYRNKIVIYSIREFYLLDSNGKLDFKLQESSFSTPNAFLLKDGLGFSNNKGFHNIHIKDNILLRTEYQINPNFWKMYYDFYPLFGDVNWILGISYSRRSRFIIAEAEKNNKKLREIPFNTNLTPTANELSEEEGEPEFSFSFDGACVNFVTIRNKTIYILKLRYTSIRK